MATHELIAAPVGLQPGAYVKVAYAGRDQAATPAADLDLQKVGQGYRIALQWACPDPVKSIEGNTDVWVDAAAVLAPAAPGAPWITMGAENLPVVGALWRADREDLYRIDAEGLGSVRREAAPEGWRATSKYERGFWTVVFELGAWPSLRKQKMIALAVWRGDAQDRGGLKSVSQGWINVEV